MSITRDWTMTDGIDAAYERLLRAPDDKRAAIARELLPEVRHVIFGSACADIDYSRSTVRRNAARKVLGVLRMLDE